MRGPVSLLCSKAWSCVCNGENLFTLGFSLYTFDRKCHPASLGAKETESFLSNLAVQGYASKSTQRIALIALVFLYREFFGESLEDLKFENAKKLARLPVLFTHTVKCGGGGVVSPLDI